MDSLRVSDEALRRELWHSIRIGIGQGAQVVAKTIRRAQVKPTVAEQNLLELLLADEEIRRSVLPKLETDDYNGLPTAAIFRAIIEGEREGTAIDFDFLSRRTEADPSSELLPSLLMTEFQNSEDEQAETRQVAAQRCIAALRLMKVDRRISDLTSEIAAAERNGELERRDKLATEHLELARRRSALLPKAEALGIGH
jgi:replicative DNA helicase